MAGAEGVVQGVTGSAVLTRLARPRQDRPGSRQPEATVSLVQKAYGASFAAAQKIGSTRTGQMVQSRWRTINQMASAADALGWVKHTNPEPRAFGTTFISQHQGFPQPQSSETYSRPTPPSGQAWHTSTESPSWGYEQGYASDYDIHRNPAEEFHATSASPRTVYEQH